jgi:hypothetical protein
MGRSFLRGALTISALSCVALPMAAGCGSHATQGQPAPPVSSDAIICGWEPVTTDSGTDLEPEFYVLSAMNNKLKHYPALAKEASLSSVSDCATARIMYTAYAAYQQAHPGFDRYEPIEVLPAPPPRPPRQPSVSSVQKIYNGTAVTGSDVNAQPIVLIQYNTNIPVTTVLCNTIPAECITNDAGALVVRPQVYCTGTFISRNWILTAAHCLFKSGASLPFDDQFTSGSDGGENIPPQWERWYPWTVSWPNADGNATVGLASRVLTADALQIPDPRYIGVMDYTQVEAPSATSTPFDSALIYLPPDDNDGNLPPDPTTSAMALSQVIPDSTTSLQAFGSVRSANGQARPRSPRNGALGPLSVHAFRS